MIVGYHAAGLLYHDPTVAVRELADIGYESIAIRPHGAWLNPESSSFGQQVLRMGDAISRAAVRCVLDLDSPFLPDPGNARGPSLASIDAEIAAAAKHWMTTWIDVGRELGAELLTFSIGNLGGIGRGARRTDARASVSPIADCSAKAARQELRLALHPRSGDAVATVAQFERLGQWLDDDVDLLLAADIGEMLSGRRIAARRSTGPQPGRIGLRLSL